MSEPTKAQVNRRIGLYMGFYEVDSEPIPGCRPCKYVMSPVNQPAGYPDYMHDAASAIAAVEKVCRERGLWITLTFDSDSPGEWWAEFCDGVDDAVAVAKTSQPSLATAASLALFAVLGGEIQQTKGTR